MTRYYSQYYADAGHTGSLDVDAPTMLTPVWETKIEADESTHPAARLLITTDGELLVDGTDAVHALSADGELLWARPKWPSSPVVYKNGLICFAIQKRKDRVMVIDLNNSVQIEEIVFPEHVDGAYAMLFEPTSEGIVAQIQYANIPEMRKANFIVYCADADSYGYKWARRYEDQYSALVPAISAADNLIVTASAEEILCFDLLASDPEPEPRHTFPIPWKGNATWMSCAPGGLLHFAGFANGRARAAAIHAEGTDANEWISEARPGMQMAPIAPPIIGTDLVYVLSRGALSALSHHRLAWMYRPRQNEFLYATALADGGLLAVEAPNLLHRIDRSGQATAVVEVAQTITAPPVATPEGRVVVGAGEMIYAFN